MSQMPLFYRIFFLYIDPLICLSGIYLCFFDQRTFILNGIPSLITSNHLQSQIHSSPNSVLNITPATTYFIHSLGAYSLCIIFLQISLLWGFKDVGNGIGVKVWKNVQLGILLIDLGLLWAVGHAVGWGIDSWVQGDWVNVGILGMVAIIRSCFLIGIGDIN
jgi:hypothetical protein